MHPTLNRVLASCRTVAKGRDGKFGFRAELLINSLRVGTQGIRLSESIEGSRHQTNQGAGSGLAYQSQAES